MLSSTVNRIAINGDKAALVKWIEDHHSSLDIHDDLGRTPLIYSILGNRTECVEMLLKAGASPNTADSNGRTPLHWAAQKGSVHCAKLLLSKGALLKLRDFNGMTPLHLAARNHSHRTFIFILKCLMPGEIDDQDNYKRTALHWSALHGNANSIKLLVKHGANVGIPDIEGKTPLHWAASCKTPSANQCVKILLQNAPHIVNWQDYEGRTALHLAVADGTKTVVESLLSSEKCNLNPMDNMFRTPLHWAALLGHFNVVSLLLENKVDCTSSDANGATPLHYAAQNNCSDAVDVFLSDPNVHDEPDLQGRRAILWAAGKGANDVINIMHKHSIDLASPDKNGVTALHVAALSGHVSTCRLLVELTKCIEPQDHGNRTPLLYACEMGHAEVVQALLDLNTNVFCLDIDGKQALHWAAMEGHTYVCQMLLTLELSANTQDLFGRTALHCAAFGGHTDCVSVLLENGAYTSLQDYEGMTALHWACSNGHLAVVQGLLDSAAFPNHMTFTDDRYTPLDFALLCEHYEVAQCMMEHGGITLNRIQHMAAMKIQAYYRGYYVRKNFNERRKLLVKHEKLKRQRAEADAMRSNVLYKISLDSKNTDEFSVACGDGAHSDKLVCNLKSLTRSCTQPSINVALLSEDKIDIEHRFEMTSVSGEKDLDSEDDETIFKHLEARGIKLNRKRFPGKLNISTKYINDHKSLRGYDIIAATEALEKMLNHILQCDHVSILDDVNTHEETTGVQGQCSRSSASNGTLLDSSVNSSMGPKILHDHKLRHTDIGKYLCLYNQDCKKHEKNELKETQKSYPGILKTLCKKFGRSKQDESDATDQDVNVDSNATDHDVKVSIVGHNTTTMLEALEHTVTHK